MAMFGLKLTKDFMSCSICLDHLMDPVTISCGHSYCEKCITTHWSKEEKKKKRCSCPQCRQTFTKRPDLVKNSLLADLAKVLKKTGHKPAPAGPVQSCCAGPEDVACDVCCAGPEDVACDVYYAGPEDVACDVYYAGPEDVACDVCSGKKLKALKSCLSCLVSYCKTHLQPHYDSPAFKKHKLVEPCKTLQENLCPRHNEMMKMFCRTDQQLICYLCAVDEHKGHDTVSAAAEREKKQQELDKQRKNIQQTIQARKKDLTQLQQGTEAIGRSADQAVEENDEILAQLIHFMLTSNSDGRQQIRSQQETEESRIKGLQEKLKQEMAELQKRHNELKKLSQTENHSEFLRSYPSLSKSIPSSNIQIRPVTYFKEVEAVVTRLGDRLQDVLLDNWKNTLERGREVDSPQIETGDVSWPQSEPRSRAEFLKLSCDLTLDRNTANELVILGQGNRRATATQYPKSYPQHSDRFMTRPQVLSKERLPERCYFEVDCGKGGVNVAVSYRSIKRRGQLNRSTFGCNAKSWMLDFGTDSCVFKHKGVYTNIAYPQSPRVGVYLDHKAGVLCFFSVSKTMTLIHRVQTEFTEPLYAGFGLYGHGTTADIR